MSEKKDPILTSTTSTSGATAPPQLQPQPQPQPPPQQQQYDYGTFQGVAAYYTHPPPQPVVGFPQPAAPPGATFPPYYARGYHTVPGYVVAEGRPVREPKLPCCGIGVGWLLFISGFFFAALPWYVGALVLLCGRVDYREKPGLVACMVASILAVIAIVFGVANGDDYDFW